MPATPPVRNAIVSALGIEPVLAAAAVRTLPRVANVIPIQPVKPEAKQPRMNASVRHVPATPKLRASVPSAFLIAVEVRKTMIASGTRIMAIVLNWRLQICGGAFLDRLGDLLHLRGALVLRHDVLRQQQADCDGHESCHSGQYEHCPLAASEDEVLVAAFGSNQ